MYLIGFDNVLSGLLQLLDGSVLLAVLMGSIIGFVFAAIPGLTASTAIAMFLPFTFTMTTNTGFGFLLSIYCVGMYAGSIPAILISTPGTPSNAATVLDGNPMAQRGEAGKALSYAVIGSFFGGMFSALCLFLFAPVISSIALRLGPPEYFMLALMGITCVASISGKDIFKGLISSMLGMIIGMVGMDTFYGNMRFTFGSISMMSGLSVVPVLVGVFALPEVFEKANKIGTEGTAIMQRITPYKATFAEFWKRKAVMIKSSLMGVIIGAIPGTGAIISTWLAYNEAKSTSKTPEEFGHGSEEGILASETSNNSTTGGALIPMLTLGIPGDGITAMMLGALTIQGLAPGQSFLTEHPTILTFFVWVLVLSNILMLMMGLLGTRFFPKLLSVPTEYLYPFIVVFCVIGAYTSSNSHFEVRAMVILGLLAFILKSFDFSMPSFALGFVLGPIMEYNLYTSLVISNGNALIFFQRPYSLIIFALTVLIIRTMLKRKGQVGLKGKEI